MWLEEFAWLWLPLVCGVGLWGLWSIVTLKAEGSKKDSFSVSVTLSPSMPQR